MNNYPTTKPLLIKRIEDNFGKKFNRLTVLSFDKLSSGGAYMYNCICDCGKYHSASMTYLKNGTVKSCGCLAKELTNKLNIENRNRLFVHGDSHTKLHIAWVNMHDRCYNTNCKGYKNYGGRGIKICDEWQSYLPFKEWSMKNGFAKGLTIDRENNNGNYEPSNCRWISQKRNANNRRVTSFLTFNGETLSVSEWSDRFGIKIITIHGRVRAGWPVDDVLNKPVGISNRWRNKI